MVEFETPSSAGLFPERVQSRISYILVYLCTTYEAIGMLSEKLIFEVTERWVLSDVWLEDNMGWREGKKQFFT